MRNSVYRICGKATNITGAQVDLNGEYNVLVRSHTKGRYADVANRIVGNVTVDEQSWNTVEQYRNAVGNALRAQFPPFIEPFESDYCVLVGDLLRISEPIEFQTFIDSINGPYVDKGTMRFVLNHCFMHLDDLDRIYLIGSQALGVRSRGGPVAPQSDHDFVAAIKDNAPDEMQTGESGFTSFYNKLNETRTRMGLKGIDIFVKKVSALEAERNIKGEVGWEAMRGKLLAVKGG